MKVGDSIVLPYKITEIDGDKITILDGSGREYTLSLTYLKTLGAKVRKAPEDDGWRPVEHIPRDQR